MHDESPDLEELALEYYDRLQREGSGAIDALKRDHPAHADQVLAALEQLARLSLLDDPETPENAGDFRLLRRLGGGGMGVVYLAEQRSLGRLVALKFTRQGPLSSERSRARFHREIEALSKLDHPGICTVYEAGEIDGHLYLAMRYVPGESLAERLERLRAASGGTDGSTTQEINRLVQLVEQVARTLHFAHQQGIVHRDVKPANILIDQEDHPVLVDFGLAHEEGADGISQSGEHIGTPAYMAPEQVDARFKLENLPRADARTDVYSLAVTLYECLTLRLPFTAESREELFRQILGDPVPNPRQFNRRIGQGLVGILEKALEKHPHERFASALEFAEELRRWRQFEPLLTQRAGLLRRGVRWMRRHPTVASVMVTAVGGLALTSYFLYRSEVYGADLQAARVMVSAMDVGGVAPALGTRVAAQQFLKRPTADTFSRAQRALVDVAFSERILGTDLDANGLTFSPDGRDLLVHSSTQGVLLRDGRQQDIELPTLPPTQLPTGAAFSPDGRTLVVGGRDGLLHRYSLGPPIRALPSLALGKNSIAYGVAFDQRGRMAVTINRGSCRVYDSSDHYQQLEYTPPHLWLRLACLDDGRLVAGGRIWSADLSTSIPIEVPRVPEAGTAITSMSIQGGRMLVAAHHWVRLIDLGTGRAVPGPWPTFQEQVVLDGAISPSGTHAACSGLDGSLRIFELGATARQCAELRGSAGHRSISFVRGRDLLAAASASGNVEVYSLSGRLIRTMYGHEGSINAIETRPDGWVYTCGAQGDVRRFQVGPATDETALEELTPPVRMFANTDGDRIVAVGSGAAVVFDGALHVQHRFTLPAAPRFPLATFVDQDTLRVGVLGGAVLLRCRAPYSMATCKHTAALIEADKNVGTLSHGFEQLPVRVADGTWRYLGSTRRVCRWDPARPDAPPDVQYPGGDLGRSFLRFAVNRAGDELLLGSWTGEVLKIDLEGKVTWRAAETFGRVHNIDFGPGDRSALVSGSRGEALEIAFGGGMTRFGRHLNDVNSVAVDPTGELVITGSRDENLRVFTRSGRLLYVIHGHGHSIYQVLPLADGRFLSAAHGERVKVWWTDREAFARHLKERVRVPPLTPAEESMVHNLLPR